MLGSRVTGAEERDQVCVDAVFDYVITYHVCGCQGVSTCMYYVVFNIRYWFEIWSFTECNLYCSVKDGLCHGLMVYVLYQMNNNNVVK